MLSFFAYSFIFCVVQSGNRTKTRVEILLPLLFVCMCASTRSTSKIPWRTSSLFCAFCSDRRRNFASSVRHEFLGQAQFLLRDRAMFPLSDRSTCLLSPFLLTVPFLFRFTRFRKASRCPLQGQSQPKPDTVVLVKVHFGTLPFVWLLDDLAISEMARSRAFGAHVIHRVSSLSFHSYVCE